MAVQNEFFVRELDSFEEFFWQLEQLAPVGNIVGVESSGTAEFSSWQDAWAKLHLAHPALSFSIRKEPHHRPYFVRTGLSSPIQDASAGNQSVRAHMEDELKSGFGRGDGPLAHLRVATQAGITFLVLILHHALMDGRSGLVLLQDLFALRNGEQVQADPSVWPSLRTVVGVPERSGYRAEKPMSRPATPMHAAEAEAPPESILHVSHVSLSERETSALLQAAREHQTSVHGALLAAVALAGAAANAPLRSTFVASNTAHNARPSDNRASLGMITTAIVTTVDLSAGRSFWEIARDAKAEVSSGQSEAGHRRFVEVMDELTAEERATLDFAMTIPASPINYKSW